MTHALRRTVGPFAAGTRINVRNENSDGSFEVEVVMAPNATVKWDDMIFDIDAKDVVELRNKADVVSATSRTERRAFLKNLFGPTSPTKGT